MAFLPRKEAVSSVKSATATGSSVLSKDIDLDTMRVMPYCMSGCIPYGAVLHPDIDNRTLDDNLVQVTEVLSYDQVYVTPYPWKQRDLLLEQMYTFYSSGEGQRWKATIDFIRTGQVMVARWTDQLFYRVLIRNIVSKDRVTVFYIDYGSIANVAIFDIRFLHKKFTDLPASAVECRLWGVDVDPRNVEVSIQNLSKMIKVGAGNTSYGEFCCYIITNSNPDINAAFLTEFARRPVIRLQEAYEDFDAMLVDTYLLSEGSAAIRFEEFDDVEDDNEDIQRGHSKIEIVSKIQSEVDKMMLFWSKDDEFEADDNNSDTSDLLISVLSEEKTSDKVIEDDEFESANDNSTSDVLINKDIQDKYSQNLSVKAKVIDADDSDSDTEMLNIPVRHTFIIRPKLVYRKVKYYCIIPY